MDLRPDSRKYFAPILVSSKSSLTEMEGGRHKWGGHRDGQGPWLAWQVRKGS